jgi:hypothetical protein
MVPYPPQTPSLGIGDGTPLSAGDGLRTGRGEGNRHHFQPGIAAEIGVVILAIGKERCNIADGVSNALICRDLLKRKSA